MHLWRELALFTGWGLRFMLSLLRKKTQIILSGFLCAVFIFASCVGTFPLPGTGTAYASGSADCSEAKLRDLGVAIENCAGDACKSIGSSTPLSGNDNKAKIYNYFLAKGLKDFQVAGILGNMAHESGYEEQRLQGTPSGTKTPAEQVGGTSLGWGLVQWTPASKVINPITQSGKDPNDIANQLDFLWDQLQGNTTSPEKAAGDALLATTDVGSATLAFETRYERHAGSPQPERIATAEEVLNSARGGGFGAAGAAAGVDAGTSGSAASASCECSIGGAPTAAGTEDAEYKDTARNNRTVGVTVWSPGGAGAHPLVVFVPGQNQNSKASGFYKRYLQSLSSKGFVVAGLNFSDNTSSASVPQDAQDVKFMIDKVTSDVKFQSKIDTTGGIGLIGHSDGAFSAMIVGYANGSKDSRVTAVVAENGGGYAGYTYASGPALLAMVGTTDTSNKGATDNSYATIQTPFSAYAQFTGADHDKYIVDDTSRYKDAVDEITAGFLNKVLKKDATADLNAIAGKYTSLMTLQSKGTVAGAATPSTNTISKVYILGDSITHGAAAKYTETLTAKHITATISGVTSRSWNGAGTPSSGATGTLGTGQQALTTDIAAVKDADVVVIALGTNGGLSMNPIDSVVTAVRAINPDAPIYWVNIASSAANVAPLVVPFNTALAGAANTGKIKVVDWAKAVDPTSDGTHDPSALLRDGIHPKPESYPKLVDLVVGALSAGGSAAACPTGGAASVSGLANTVKTYAWPQYHPAVYVQTKPEYATAVTKAAGEGRFVGGINYRGIDCGGFVTTVMIDSGFDPHYNSDGKGGSTAIQQSWLEANWQSLGALTSTSQLQPGDVAVMPGHTYMFVGTIPGFDSQFASASLDERAPMAGHEGVSGSGVVWYRKK